MPLEIPSSARLAPGDAVLLISIDSDRSAADREAAEDRSLNLELRRRRVRSEIFRVTAMDDVALLEEFAFVPAARPMLLLIHADSETDALRPVLVRLGERPECRLNVRFGEGSHPAPTGMGAVINLPDADRATIVALADALVFQKEQ